MPFRCPLSVRLAPVPLFTTSEDVRVLLAVGTSKLIAAPDLQRRQRASERVRVRRRSGSRRLAVTALRGAYIRALRRGDEDKNCAGEAHTSRRITRVVL